MKILKLVLTLFFLFVIACNDFYIVFEGNNEEGITAIGIQPKTENASIDSIIVCNSKNVEVFKYKRTHQRDTLKGLSYILLRGEIKVDRIYNVRLFSNIGVSNYKGKVIPNIQFE